MRVLMGTLLAAALAAPVMAQEANWAETLSVTPRGGLLIGNPAAELKLVEFGSLTCSHCATFHAAGVPGLKARYLRSGKVSYEFRSFVRNGADYAASLIAACLPAARQAKLLDAFFDLQAVWLEPFTKVSPDAMAGLRDLQPEAQFVKLAELGGLDRWVERHGVETSAARTCLADRAAIERLARTRAEAVERYRLEGTPTFVLNDSVVPGVFDWQALEPKLVEAMKGR
ncbi:MAG: DsbA family protein [Polymorphobacter sp.]|uniref:DsbA family protein n=1 Tax=Polymorphobacter sp. TaxID=1909290 RepID=UPI003A8A21E7